MLTTAIPRVSALLMAARAATAPKVCPESRMAPALPATRAVTAPPKAPNAIAWQSNPAAQRVALPDGARAQHPAWVAPADLLVAEAKIGHRLEFQGIAGLPRAELVQTHPKPPPLKQVFDALRELMTPPDPPKRPIGFVTTEDKGKKSPRARGKT